MEPVSLKSLLEAGCHFGHKSERWNPKAKDFIYQARDGIHVIDLAKTKTGLEKAAEFLRQLALEGKIALFIGTKRQAASCIKEEADRVGAPYISERWIGGFLTNWEEVHKNLEKIRKLAEEEKVGAWKKFPKHERVKLGRYLMRLKRIYGGVIELTSPPEALVIVDVRRESVAVKEANRQGTRIVAIVDTNSDPTPIDFPVPANDDAVGSVRFIIHYLAEAYKEGKDEYAKGAEKMAKKVAAEKVDTVEKKEVTKGSEVADKAQMAEKETESKKKVKQTKVQETADTTKDSDVKPKKRGRPKKENSKSQTPTSK